MLERLATAGAGGESLANEVDQLRSQVRVFFFQCPIFFAFSPFSLFSSLSLPSECGCYQCSSKEMTHSHALLGKDGRKIAHEEGRWPLLHSASSVFFSIDSTSPPPLLSFFFLALNPTTKNHPPNKNINSSPRPAPTSRPPVSAIPSSRPTGRSCGTTRTTSAGT